MSPGQPLSLHRAAGRLAAGELSSVELTDACLARATQTAALNAFIHLDADAARAQAIAADARRAAGTSRGPLDGVPVALKDNIVTRDAPTTCASAMLAGYVAPYDATVVRRLRAAGAVLLGKLNLDEFAMGASNEHSAAGPVLNPWDVERTPGGSSGGAAAAVASGAIPAALGSDSGGSLRQPASFCNIVGVKPTYGRVSRYGLVALASSMDQIGPQAREVTDAALVLQAIAGHDRRDATTVDRPVPDLLTDLEAGAAGVRIGLPREYLTADVDPEVGAAIDSAAAAYARLGAELVEVSLPHAGYTVATYVLLCTAEASSNLARFDAGRYGQRRHGDAGLREMVSASRSHGFGREVTRRILLGTFVLSRGYFDATYDRAQRARTLIARDFAAALARVDALLTPTAPTPAFPLGARLTDPIAMYEADRFTAGASLAGLPALSLPAGFTAAGLPIGMQLIGQPWAEAELLRLARAFEREHDFHLRRPASHV